MLKAKSQMDAIPDVRTEKVEKIKTDIVNGTYKIDGSQVAFNMIKESILDELA
jgi:flagellar biosynthesis anti-sigma factor FlgM